MSESVGLAWRNPTYHFRHPRLDRRSSVFVVVALRDSGWDGTGAVLYGTRPWRPCNVTSGDDHRAGEPCLVQPTAEALLMPVDRSTTRRRRPTGSRRRPTTLGCRSPGPARLRYWHPTFDARSHSPARP